MINSRTILAGKYERKR